MTSMTYSQPTSEGRFGEIPSPPHHPPRGRGDAERVTVVRFTSPRRYQIMHPKMAKPSVCIAATLWQLDLHA